MFWSCSFVSVRCGLWMALLSWYVRSRLICHECIFSWFSCTVLLGLFTWWYTKLSMQLCLFQLLLMELVPVVLFICLKCVTFVWPYKSIIYSCWHCISILHVQFPYNWLLSVVFMFKWWMPATILTDERWFSNQRGMMFTHRRTWFSLQIRPPPHDWSDEHWDSAFCL